MTNKKGISTVLAALVLGACAIICVALCIILPKSYEKSIAAQEAKLPESAISTYLTAIKNNDFEEAYNTSLLVSPHYNSLEDYSATLQAIYQDVDLNKAQYVEIQGEGEGLYYDIVSNGVKIATLNLVEIKGVWCANTLFKGENEYRIEIPTGQTFTVNNLKVNEVDCVEKKVAASNFNGLSNDSDAPLVDVYVLSNLISEPIISTQDSSLTTIKDVLSNTYYIGTKNSDSELEEVFTNAAMALAKYPTKDGSLGAISAMSITNSDFYNRIKTMDNQWYAAHNSATFSNMKVSDVILQAEDAMIGNVTFDYKITASSASKNYHCGYQISFLKVGTTWKIAGLGIDNEME